MPCKMNGVLVVAEYPKFTLVNGSIKKYEIEERYYKEFVENIKDNSKLYIEVGGDFFFKHSIQSIEFE